MLSSIVMYRGFDRDKINENKDTVKTVQYHFKENTSMKFENDMISTTITNPPLYTSESATLIANTTSIQEVFQRLNNQFERMYRRKAFLHWYKGEGMEEEEFIEADRLVRDLILDYNDLYDQ